MTELRAELVVPQGRQRRARGRALIACGWTFRIVGTLLGLIGIQRGRMAGTGQLVIHLGESPVVIPFWGRLLIALALSAAGVLLFLVGRVLAGRGRQHIAHIIRSLTEIDGRPFVLYLRPFADDLAGARMPTHTPAASLGSFFRLSGRTQEESLREMFRDFGTLVAIGRPGEILPLPGALRAYLPVDDWQDTVRHLIARARLVVMGAGPGPGTIWELVEAVRTVQPAQLVLVVHHEADVYEQFRKAAAAEFAARLPQLRREKGPHWLPPALPDYPPIRHPERLTWDYVLKGVIYFEPGWKPRFLRFDPTALRRRTQSSMTKSVNRSLEQVLRYLRDAGPPSPNR
ncbi:hypothetical protein [Streptomyces sp. NPDC005336]|uniref:hypothetical protein n=1 Tax=unclassified Streptomyces TaxID=2593676 RepID=UPI0033AA282C